MVNLTRTKGKVEVLNLLRISRQICFHGQLSMQETKYQKCPKYKEVANTHFHINVEVVMATLKHNCSVQLAMS